MLPFRLIATTEESRERLFQKIPAGLERAKLARRSNRVKDFRIQLYLQQLKRLCSRLFLRPGPSDKSVQIDISEQCCTSAFSREL